MTPYYQQDDVTLWHGDYRDIVPHVSCDLVVTDPPYGIAWKRSENKARSSKAHRGIQGDQDTTARDHCLQMLSDKPAIVFGSFYAPYPVGVKQVLVWHKPADAGVVGSTTGYRRDVEPVFLIGDWPMRSARWTSILSSHGGIGTLARRYGHPHVKPVHVLCQLINASPPGVILDPFVGSGSTLIAAVCCGRKAIGIELEEQYCAIAAQRLRQGMLYYGC